MSILSLLALGALCFWLVDHTPVPFLWIALVALGYCGWSLRRARATYGKVLWLNAGVAILVLAAVEAALWMTSAPLVEFDPVRKSSVGHVSHVDYGYGPLAPSRTRVVKLIGGKPIYDVVYTVDDDGLRASPPDVGASRRGCVLFLGCSYTFGEGVEDDETMPWQVGVKTGGRFAVRNLAFQGWGPHQVLSALQSGHAERAVRCDVTHVVYLALYWHASRVAGRSYWDRNGPRYVLDGEGRAVRAGYLSDVELDSVVPRAMLDRLKQSFVYRKYFAAHLDPFDYAISPSDLDLMAAVIDRSREEIATRFPKASFHVLFWDIGLQPKWIRQFLARVSRPGIGVHRLSDAIPDYGTPFDPRYVLSSIDRHPSALIHARIADYVVGEILGEPPLDDLRRAH